MTDKLFRLECGFQNYDWGKLGQESAVAQFISNSNPEIEISSTTPYAELWMGTHPTKPSFNYNTSNKLIDIISSDPERYLGSHIAKSFNNDLPFLFKVLSIEKVLSIQAHPDKNLAKLLNQNDPKNYPDNNHKPEMAIALTKFEGFCGFKPLTEIHYYISNIPELLNLIGGSESLNYFNQNIQFNSNSPINKKILKLLFSNLMNSNQNDISLNSTNLIKRVQSNPEIFQKFDPDLPILIKTLNKQFPNDIGLFCGCLLLNYCKLNPGEAIFLKAKDPHAYISGNILECMASSDNVIRAGFTPKFKDVNVLVNNLTYNYDSVENQKLKPILNNNNRLILNSNENENENENNSLKLYNPPIEEFEVLEINLSHPNHSLNFKKFNGPSILITTEGSGFIKNLESNQQFTCNAGYIYFISANLEIQLISNSSNFTSYRAFCE
ncbi:mannose-6-phosphate isomerase PMI40 [Ascoidea rubescens DSM 1968]|uniref:Mannose-6-phosphate isomerase n=1 Tax=Ascoidea rubescens DSM 1968 TaxID=1344418 RepID=A0A1D2VHR9_9ASCO|nr:mannose-6-phosphate isomerase [Ascoidea rubescens DSM 1968]ODV61090.1 mannose-6-phosphate isomerase [Ascoidea rubescens DSM 1968]